MNEQIITAPCGDCIEGKRIDGDRAIKCHNGIVPMCAHVELKSRISALEAELLEQARLHGMGSEREAALRGDIERLTKRAESAEARLKTAEEERDKSVEMYRHLRESFAYVKKERDASGAENRRLREAYERVLRWAKARNFSPDCESGAMVVALEAALAPTSDTEDGK